MTTTMILTEEQIKARLNKAVTAVKESGILKGKTIKHICLNEYNYNEVEFIGECGVELTYNLRSGKIDC